MGTMSGAGVSTAEREPEDEAHPPAVRVVPSSEELPARIVAARVPLGTRLRELWGSRELFTYLVRKELRVKYKASVLGILWSLLNPAVMLLVYDIVFTKFMHNTAIPHFWLYLFCALIVWNLFQLALMGSASTIVANAAIVKKVSFPREILPLAQVGTAVMFFFFQLIVLVLFLAGFQLAPVWHLLPLLVFAFVDLVVFAAALSVFLSAVNVYFRDVEHLITVLLLAWQWGIPMVYSYDYINQGDHRWIARLFLADPLVPVVLTFQRVIYGYLPNVTAGYPLHFYLLMLTWVLLGSIVLFLGAMAIFGRIEGNFAEEL